MADDDYRRQLQGAMESATRDPFVQFLEKERAAGREYGDSPEFLKAMKEGRMRPYPGAPPGTMSIDGVAPPPMDWDKLIKSIPPDIVMQQRAQAPGGAADFVPPQGLTPNMHEAAMDQARNGPPPAPPPQALRGEMMDGPGIMERIYSALGPFQSQIPPGTTSSQIPLGPLRVALRASAWHRRRASFKRCRSRSTSGSGP
jgi:hypothetical protein